MRSNANGNLTRRRLLKVGGIGLALSNSLRWLAANDAKSAKGQSAIVINLGGGPTHVDSFDLKPDAPAEFRGEFNPIDTNVAGIQISEHLPKLASCADKYAILRGVSHAIAGHELATSYLSTGSRPVISSRRIKPPHRSITRWASTSARNITPPPAAP